MDADQRAKRLLNKPDPRLDPVEQYLAESTLASRSNARWHAARVLAAADQNQVERTFGHRLGELVATALLVLLVGVLMSAAVWVASWLVLATVRLWTG